MILEPKLGNLADDYHWGESNFAEEEIVMHAKPGVAPTELQELGRAAHRRRAQRDEGRQSARAM